MPVTSDEVRQFEQRVRSLQRSAGSLTNEARAQVRAIVDEHRRRINDLISHYPPKTQLPAGDVPRLSMQIRREVDDMIADATEALQQAQEGIWSKGVAAGQELATNLGLEGAFFSPSSELLSVATRYTADLIRSISDELLPKVNGVLSRGVLGSLTPYETMQELDGLLGRTGERGVSYQAERIVRTEVQRVYSIALDTQVQSLTTLVDSPSKLLKQWVSGPFRPGRREEHHRIDGQQVPVGEPFKLYDGRVKLMYPRDPSGPPGETINCGCTWIIVPESLVDAMK